MFGNIIFCLFQIAVVVFPKPDELKIRSDKRFTEMGKEVPPDAVNKMIGTVSFFFFFHFLYMLSDGFKFIIFLNLQSSNGLFILFMVVAANYVLPKSKDMPRSDEFFDQVFSNLVYNFGSFDTVIVNHNSTTSPIHILPKSLICILR